MPFEFLDITGQLTSVRVYRRSPGGPPQLVGVVEAVRTGRKTPFHNIEELCEVLVCVVALRKSPASDLGWRQSLLWLLAPRKLADLAVAWQRGHSRSGV